MGEGRLVTGYVHGRPFRLIVQMVDGVLMEDGTATVWTLMRDAAAADGVRLKLNAGWRSMDQQTKAWSERQDPAIRAVKGIAAKPGWSNHQGGIALDINGCGGLIVPPKGVAMPEPMHPTPVYAWLAAHAPFFGFVRTVPSELWHWERRGAPEHRVVEPL